MHFKKFGGRAQPGPVEDAEALLQTSYAVVLTAGNVPSDSLHAVRGAFCLGWRKGKWKGTEMNGDGHGGMDGKNVSITIIARDFMFNS